MQRKDGPHPGGEGFDSKSRRMRHREGKRGRETKKGRKEDERKEKGRRANGRKDQDR